MNSRFLTICLTVIALGLGIAAPTSQTIAQEKIDFGRQVKPILSDNCFACHGPDEGQRESDFRFDQKESALSTEHSVIVPSDIESSLLVKRILSDDPDEVMPPSSHRKKLTEQQKRTLVQWICLLYTSPSPRDRTRSRMPSSA